MHNHDDHAPKEKSSIFFFVPLLFIGLYLLYVIVSVPYRYGVNIGLAEAPYKKPVEQEAADEVFDHRKLIEPSEELVALGARIYATNCATCHGDSGKGDGTAGVRLATRPRDFAGPGADWKNGASVLTMYGTLSTGVGLMPSFPALNPRQKYAVIHYVHSEYMSEVGYPADDQAAIDALPAPGGAEKISINPYAEARVPVRYAIEKLLREKQQEQQPSGEQQSNVVEIGNESVVKAEHSDVNAAQRARAEQGS